MLADRLSPFDLAALRQVVKEWSEKSQEEWKPRQRRSRRHWGIEPEDDPFVDADGLLRWRTIKPKELIQRLRERPDFLFLELQRKSWVVAACRFFRFLLEFLDNRVPAELSEAQIGAFLSPLVVLDPERTFLDDLPRFVRLLRDGLTPAQAAALRMYELELHRAGAPGHVTTRHLTEALHLEDRRRKVYERLVRAKTLPPLAAWPQVPISNRRSKVKAG